MDFDLAEVDNDALRGLDVGVNEVIGRGVEVRSVYVDADDAATTAGLVRSLSVAPPPTPDGRLRIIEIDGIDRQACGGTHLSNTGPVAAVPHHQGRVQGQAQPAHPLRARGLTRQPSGAVVRSPGMDGGFVERFDELYAVGYRAGFAVLGRRADAEDCAQEALARALVRWDRVAEYAVAWVARVATNLALDRARRLARRPPVAASTVLPTTRRRCAATTS